MTVHVKLQKTKAFIGIQSAVYALLAFLMIPTIGHVIYSYTRYNPDFLQVYKVATNLGNDLAYVHNVSVRPFYHPEIGGKSAGWYNSTSTILLITSAQVP